MKTKKAMDSIDSTDWIVKAEIIDSVKSTTHSTNRFQHFGRLNEGYVKLNKLPRESWKMGTWRKRRKTNEDFSSTSRWTLGSFLVFSGVVKSTGPVENNLHEILPRGDEYQVRIGVDVVVVVFLVFCVL